MRKLIAGNWKMNGLRAQRDELEDLARRVRGKSPDCDILVCPPATLLADGAAVLADTPIALGGQDCHPAEKGAHTGDISAEMLADAGCSHVIVGHSERRTDHGEDDVLIRRKAEAAHRAGLCAIVCIGESGPQRREGQTLFVIEEQLAGSLPDAVDAANTVIAYEPVWAIGSGETPTHDEIGEVHRAIRQALADKGGEDEAAIRILYGGSVKGGNAREILGIDSVDGALVGGASLTAEQFWPIVEAGGS